MHTGTEWASRPHIFILFCNDDILFVYTVIRSEVSIVLNLLCNFMQSSEYCVMEQVSCRCRMAPEVVACETLKDTPYDTKADIWSLGRMCFCCLVLNEASVVTEYFLVAVTRHHLSHFRECWNYCCIVYIYWAKKLVKESVSTVALCGVALLRLMLLQPVQTTSLWDVLNFLFTISACLSGC